eukprot:jgi/Ulvmu1/11129/UM071_0012.1
MSGSAGDVAALDRIATRVALTKEEDLETLVGKLICPVILKLSTDDNEVKAKVTQLISVINQRVKAAPELKLPTSGLLKVYRDHHQSPLVANIALMQLVIAIQRSSTTDLRELVNPLVTGVSQADGKHKRDLLHLAFFAITTFEGGLNDLSTQEKLRAALPFLTTAADRRELLDFGLKLMLYRAPRRQEPANLLQASRFPGAAQRGLGPLTAPVPVPAGASAGTGPSLLPASHLHEAAMAQLGAFAAGGAMLGEAGADAAEMDVDEGESAPVATGGPGAGGGMVGPVAPGLSSNDVADVSQVPSGLPLDAASLDKRRLGLLKLVNAAEDFEAQEVALVALAASCCPDEQVSRTADTVLQRRCTLDGIKPSIDLEDEALLTRFFELIAGSGQDVAPTRKRPVAEAALRMRLLRICCKSVKAANMMPRTLEAIIAGLERTRVASVKLATCEFVVWVLRHADDAAMASMAKPAFDRVIGSLSMMDPSDSGPSMQLRGFLYQAVGELAQRAPEVFHNDVEIAGSFFQALAAEPDGIRATVQEAINRLAAAYKGLSEGSKLARGLRAMLEAQARSQSESVRGCALNWAIEVFPFDNAFARMMCMRLASDPRPGIRAAAQKGLKMSEGSSAGKRAAGTDAGLGARHPSFSQMLAAVRSQYKPLRVSPARSTLAAPVETLSAILTFLDACHARELSAASASQGGTAKASRKVLEGAAEDADMDGGREQGDGAQEDADDDEDAGMDVDGEAGATQNGPDVAQAPEAAAAGAGRLLYGGPEHLVLLEHALVREAPTELQLIALTQLLAVAHVDPAAPAAHVRTRLPWLRAFLSHVNADVRLAAGRLLGSITAALPRETTLQLLSDLVQRLPGGGVGADAAATTAAANGPAMTGLSAANGPTMARADAAATTAAATNPAKPSAAAKFAETHGSLVAAGLVASSLHIAGGGGADGGVSGIPEAAQAVAAELCNGDVKVALAAVRALGFMAIVGAETLPIGEVKLPDLSAPAKSAAGGAAPATMADVVRKLALLLKDPRLGSDTKARVLIVHACGHLVTAASDESLRTALVDILLAQTPAAAPEELHLAVGEALCLALTGCSETVAKALLFSPAATLAHLRRKRELPDGLPGGKPDAIKSAAASQELKQKILSGAVDKATSGTAEERAGASVWLVLLLVLCGGDAAVAEALPRLQGALVGLLAGDTSDLVQDMATHGLAAAYSAGSDATKEQLVTALVEKLQMAGPALQAARVDAASKDGAAKPAMPAAGQGSLATYRELCTLATSLGKPQLLYALIDVAAEATPSAARRGAALGLHAESTEASRALLQPHIAALLPLLYRTSYDPNSRVSDAMTHLLATILPQRAPALTEHFAAVMKELLASLGARSWRARQAACLATADLLPGRRWPLLQPHFAALWDAALRVADDLKDSVRVNGERLLRALGNITCRLADAQQTPAAEASAALAVSLPVLVDKGLQCRSRSVRDASISTLASIVAVAAPHEIAGQLAPLVTALLEALSSLEASAFGMLDMHADRLGVDRNALEEKRVQAASKTPTHGALDTCARLVDEKSVNDVAAALARLVRQGVGVNTRTGTARFMVALTLRLPAATLQKPTGELLKALLPAVRAERSGVTQRAFASAIGALSKSASGKRLDWLVGEASGMLGNAEDDDARKAGGLVLQQVCRCAAQRLHAAATAALLPLALRSRYDPDTAVAAAAADIMTELGASAATVLRNASAAAAAPVVADLGPEATRARRAAAAAAATGFATDGGAALAPPSAAALAAALVAALQGRAWTGKEAVPAALAAVASAVPAAFTAAPLPRPDPPVPGGAPAPDDGAIVRALVAAAVKPGGREAAEAAAEALVKVLHTFKDRDHIARLEAVLKSLEGQLQREKGQTDEGAMEDDAPASLPMLACLSVATAALTHSPPGDTTTAFASRLAPLCRACLSSVRPWKLRLQAALACEAMLRMLTHLLGAGQGGKSVTPAGSAAEARRALLGTADGDASVLMACIELKSEKVAQVRAACVACVQAATPLLNPNTDTTLIPALTSVLVDMGSGDKDPAIKTQAAKLLKGDPYSEMVGGAMEQ